MGAYVICCSEQSVGIERLIQTQTERWALLRCWLGVGGRLEVTRFHHPEHPIRPAARLCLAVGRLWGRVRR